MSRPGSVRGRSRTERLGSDSREDLPPPATPFKDDPEKAAPPPDKPVPAPDRQQTLPRPTPTVKWPRADSAEERPRPEPQRIIKPEFKPMASPVDVTIRSPSLGAKLPDQFPSHGTAFRNVASPDPRPDKVKKEKYSVSKGSSYFTRGSEEIWLVKKKDIEEIEERVLDSFRRAGGGACVRSESMRPSSDAGAGSAATLGRSKRQMYARSESLDPAWAGARAQTLKRQSSVACTCGHDKKPHAGRPKHSHAVPAAQPGAAPAQAEAPRARSRSHGDEAPAHVLDKYETLV